MLSISIKPPHPHPGLQPNAGVFLFDICSKVKERSIEFYECQINQRFMPRFGHLPVKSITSEMVDDFVAELVGPESKISPTTVNHSLVTLKSILSDAERWGYVGRNVAAGCKRARQEKKELEHYEPEDIKNILTAAQQNKRDYALMVVATNTGARRGEILGLTWGDISFRDKTISFNRQATPSGKLAELKTGHSHRTIRVPKCVIEVLETWRTEQIVNGGPNPDELLFPSDAGTPLLGGNLLRRIYWPILAVAGVRRLSFHAIRHSFATTLLGKGVPLPVVSRRMGHSSVVVTAKHYSHVLIETEDTADKALEDAYFDTLEPALIPA